MDNDFLKDDVIAVVVSYNPDEGFQNNIYHIVHQVSEVLIINNGNLAKLEDPSIISKKVSIINNRENIGLAAALNQGLEYALNKNYKLMLTLDQDTQIGDDAVKFMLDVLNTDKKIVSVGPIYNGKVNFHTRNPLYKKVTYLITSGNLFRIDKAIEVGGFNSALFIDSVDFDFSLALRKAGGILVMATEAYMKHSIGILDEKNFLIFKYYHSEHTALRYYYMYRNLIFIYKKYFRVFPLFCLKLSFSSLISLSKFFILDRNKKQKFRYIKKGIKDGLFNISGEYRSREI
jgi:rhamnosyltransferase